jgi:hypothetical protein
LDASDATIKHEHQHRQGDAGGLMTIVNDMHKALPSENKKNTGIWRNPFDKPTIIRIWKTGNPNLLKSDQERHAYKLLHKYNGSYAAYMELMDEASKRKDNTKKMGAHIKWDAHGLIANPDIDGRARELYEEYDRAVVNKNFWMDSLVLHTNDQRFPTEMLRKQLEEALDAVLSDQVGSGHIFRPAF